MPGFDKSDRRRRLAAGAVLVAVLLAAGTEIAFQSVRAFWVGHPITAAFVGFGITLSLTVLVVDEVLRRRAFTDWEFVGQTALRRLSGEALVVCDGLIEAIGFDNQAERMLTAVERVSAGGPRPGAGGPALLPGGFEDALEQILDDRECAPLLAEFVGAMSRRLDEAIAQWAPVMLRSEHLARMLNIFASMRDMLGHVANCLDDASRSAHARGHVWTNLRVYFLLFAGFDNLKRQATGEPLLFGPTARDMDRAWGLPFAAQAALLAGAKQS
jgi:hypothetical protein